MITVANTADFTLSDWELMLVHQPICKKFTIPSQHSNSLQSRKPLMSQLVEHGLYINEQIRNRVLSREEKLKDAKELLESPISSLNDHKDIVLNQIQRCRRIVERLYTLQDEKKRDQKEVMKAYRDLKIALGTEIEGPESTNIPGLIKCWSKRIDKKFHIIITLNH